MDKNIYVYIGYLIASVLFIIGLKRMSHPRSAVAGNTLSAVGMLLAVVITLVGQGILGLSLIVIGVLAGSIVGIFLALKIKMTAMPQLVALFNGFGGIASVLVAGVALHLQLINQGGLEGQYQQLVATILSGLIGSVTFFGSAVAFAKLQGLISEKPLRYPGEQVVKVLLGLTVVSVGVLMVMGYEIFWLYWLLAGLAALLGLLLVLPIGGADMPIVIALLNSYSGIAAAATGFVLNNSVLIIAGSLVGASGIILTRIMCKAMNRSLANVLFGGLGGGGQTVDLGDVYGGKIVSTSAEEVAMILAAAQRVMIVPGYGMAVARAQTAVRQLTEQLEKSGVEVEFGIHPVAGRMPGHMNVLLAEEQIDYSKLLELEQANARLPATDVAIVIGANDVVNPLARQASGSPVAGMPIINVDQARTVIVIKRSLSPGFAGIQNPLFAADNTLMFFGDGKKAVEDLVAAYKEAK